MTTFLILMLAKGAVLPTIDRTSLELQARAEALQPHHAIATRPIVHRASSGAPLDLNAITTICRAAGDQTDPAGFLATLSHAYSLGSNEATSLRSSCAAYLAGRADARRAR